MFSLTKVMINSCVESLQAGYRQTYGNQKPDYADAIAKVAKIALEKIAASDALYHDIEHTILVTLVGQEILRGKQIRYANVSCEDWLHAIVSMLLHDIGYVKGVCQQDQPKQRLYDKGINGELISLPVGATDASLTPYHVDRGKLFVEETLREWEFINIETIKTYIELTRFPVPKGEEHQDTVDYPGLVRAADLIGQLSDPRYLEKMPALFYEFEETGTNKILGYRHPADLRAGYPNFFWNVVYQYIQEGLHHLEATEQGKEIIASLYKNVAIVEQEANQAAVKKVAIAQPTQKICNYQSCQQTTLYDPYPSPYNQLGDVQLFNINQEIVIFLEGKAGVCYSVND